MIGKLKEWLFRGVILKKVVGKLVKHAVTTGAALAGATPVLKDAGVSVDWTKLETYLTILVGGLAGSAWNYIEHRFSKKPSVPVA